eukprot:5517120-Prymnesium_polylepis.1
MRAEDLGVVGAGFCDQGWRGGREGVWGARGTCCGVEDCVSFGRSRVAFSRFKGWYGDFKKSKTRGIDSTTA